MLDKIIINRLRELQSKGSIKETKYVDQTDNKVDEFIGKLDNKELSKELDSLIGEIHSSLADMYFEAGFKEGLKLGSEIKQLNK